MKELEGTKRDKTELQVQKQQEKKATLVGQITPHRGHKVFSINTATGFVKEAEYEKTLETVYVIGRKNQYVNNKRIMIEKYCVYISALNKKNAVKHYNKSL